MCFSAAEINCFLMLMAFGSCLAELAILSMVFLCVSISSWHFLIKDLMF